MTASDSSPLLADETVAEGVRCLLDALRVLHAEERDALEEGYLPHVVLGVAEALRRAGHAPTHARVLGALSGGSGYTRGTAAVLALQDALREYRFVREDLEKLAREQGAAVVAEALRAAAAAAAGVAPARPLRHRVRGAA